jgi:para-nitrobenzyl esterase
MPEAPTPENTRALYAKMFGSRADEAAKLFPAGTAEEALQSVTDLAGDRFIGYSTWKWLDEHGRTGGRPVYRYLYARPRPATVATTGDDASPAGRGASHSAEIEYAMGNLRLNPVFAWTPDDFKVSETMQRYFVNFVKTGDPNGAGLPRWPVGTPTAGGQVMRMRIDVDSRAEPEPRARYLFLDQVFGAAGRAAAP